MKKRVSLSLVVLLCGSPILAQNYFHSSYSWDKNPKVYVPKENEKSAEMVIVAQKKIFETAYDSDNQAVLYETIHIIYHVNSEKAVDRVNKGYMPLRNNLEEIDLKARCITPDNKVIYYNKATLKKIDNLENSGPYKIFAIDGVETGCDVEILYTNKKNFSSYAYYYAQSSSPVALYETRIISPKNLVFETHAYNGMGEFKSDVSDTAKNHMYLIRSDIPGAEEEKYAFEKANQAAFAYQLMYNTSRKKSKLYTWDIISREYYTSLYALEKADLKSIEKVLDKNRFMKLNSNEEKIKAFDSYFKTNYDINSSFDELEFQKAIETRKMDHNNGMKFYIGALKLMSIPFELIVTSERDELKFDPKFPTYIYLKEYVLGFPELNKFVSPMSIYSRLGYPDPDVLNAEGLFIKEVNVGDISSSSAKIKRIGANDPKGSYHNTDVIANLNFVEKTAHLSVTQSVFGYSGFYIQPIYRYLNNEQKDEIHKNYYLTENTSGVKNLQVSQTDEGDLFVNPMQVKFNIEQNDYVENAGNKFIFKVGLLIGPQAELYQEKQRIWPGEIYFTHYFQRTLEINIPDGYKATNLNDLNTSKVCMVNEKEAAVFRSSYELKENKIVVTVYEDYQTLEYPLKDFEPFRAVINAAADFNKKNLIFEKK